MRQVYHCFLGRLPYADHSTYRLITHRGFQALEKESFPTPTALYICLYFESRVKDFAFAGLYSFCPWDATPAVLRRVYATIEFPFAIGPSVKHPSLPGQIATVCILEKFSVYTYNGHSIFTYRAIKGYDIIGKFQ
jgi:hypothetical protein